MADTQKVVAKTGQGRLKAAGISDASQGLSLVAGSEKGGQSSLSKTTPATTPNDSSETLQKADLITLNMKAGLVAGAYSDFQSHKKARLSVRQIHYQLPNGKKQAAILSIMSVDGQDLELVALESFLDFAVVPLGSVLETVTK